MSESVTATASTTATTTQTSAPSSTSTPQASGNSSANAHNPFQGGSANAKQGEQAANQTQNAQQTQKRLGSEDMDALVTVKINGQTKELALKEVIKLQQLEQASQEKMRRAAEIERRAQELFNADLEQFAKMKNLDLDRIAEERLAKAYEMAQMTPEQRRLHELETRETQRQQAERQFKQKFIDEIKSMTPDLPPGIENASPEQLEAYLGQVKQVYAMTEQNLEREFVDAWKQTGLPKTKFIGAQMAFMARNAKNENGEPLQIGEAAAKVKEAYVSDLRDFVGQMDAQAIHDMLGKEIIQKLRDFDVQRVTGQAASQPIQSQSPGGKPASEKKYLNQLEWRKAMGLA